MSTHVEAIDGAEVRWRWDGFLPRSYLFSLEQVRSKPAGLRPISVPRGHLFISPDYECHVECADSSFVVLIGHCIDLARPSSSEADIARSLLRSAMQHGIDSMLAETDDLSGRFAAICYVGDDWHVVGDACATRTIYFAEDRPAIASHSILLGNLTGVEPRTVMFRHYWCALPGNASPVEGVRLLPANFVLTLGDRKMRRFWPRSRRCERPAAEVTEEVEQLLSKVVEVTAARWKPALSLTAGLDSRLSLSMYKGVSDLVTFTYERDQQDKLDADLAAQLSRRLGIPHRRLPLVERRCAQGAYELIERMVDCPIDKRIGPICLSGFQESNDTYIHVRSSLGEVGRSFWRRHPGMPTTLDPSNWPLVSLSKWTAGLPGREQAAEYMRAEMQRFFAAVGYDSVDPRSPEIMGYDVWDLAYIEHRMSTWHGPCLMAHDMAFDTSIPFNFRRMLELLMSVPLPARKSGTVFRSIVQHRCPEIADIPINPRPRRTLGQLAYGAYRQLKRRAGFLRGWQARFSH
jgi:hypothetical protein